ncbi:hypothetical protein J2X76_006314 [Neorhizobium sp. 2083]|uniref:hypothetical protein n=1 Tax=Neorhizobium sp. 2083 TaxID=2817762 RepID=UPI00285AB156|nr:hypothetical protein [Neorhizobium sp. 2083]MDR6821113.1 hypothetical protein [Neorhizobium sp. 2083]
MAVIEEHRSEIDALASWVAVKNPEIRKLLEFSREQYARCLWGIVPRSIEDEASPLNECSHAYLAADREMLVRMRNLPIWQDKAIALFDDVEADMINRSSSLVLCAFSATTFNTASPVNPDWHDFATHVPSLLTAIGAALAICGTVALLLWPKVLVSMASRRFRSPCVFKA